MSTWNGDNFLRRFSSTTINTTTYIYHLQQWFTKPMSIWCGVVVQKRNIWFKVCLLREWRFSYIDAMLKPFSENRLYTNEQWSDQKFCVIFFEETCSRRTWAVCVEGTTVGSKLTCACHLLSSFYCSSPYSLAARFRYEEKAHQAVMPVLVPVESVSILKVQNVWGLFL